MLNRLEPFQRFLATVAALLGFAVALQWAGQVKLDVDELHSAMSGGLFSWVVDRHPPFAGMVGYLWANLTGYSTVAFFALSKLNALLALWVIYRLNRHFLSGQLALLATAAYAASFAFVFMAITTDNNSVLHAIWPATVLFVWRGLQQDRLTDWLLAGVLMGFALLAKYHSVLLGGSLVLAALWAAPRLERPFPWKLGLGVLVACAMLIPHLLAEFKYGFPTLTWATASASGDTYQGATGRLSIPGFLAANAGYNLFGLGVLLFVIWRKRLSLRPKITTASAAAEWRFLLTIGAVFPLLPVVLSLVFGISLKPTWGFNALFLTPTLLLWCLSTRSRDPIPNVTWPHFMVFLPLYLALMSIVVALNARQDVGRPPATIDAVHMIDEAWQAKSDQPLELVVSTSETGFGMVFYSTFKPKLAPYRGVSTLAWVLDSDGCFQGPALIVQDDIVDLSTMMAQHITPPASFTEHIHAPGRWTNLTVTKDVTAKIYGFPEGFCVN